MKHFVNTNTSTATNTINSTNTNTDTNTKANTNTNTNTNISKLSDDIAHLEEVEPLRSTVEILPITWGSFKSPNY